MELKGLLIHRRVSDWIGECPLTSAATLKQTPVGSHLALLARVLALTGRARLKKIQKALRCSSAKQTVGAQNSDTSVGGSLMSVSPQPPPMSPYALLNESDTCGRGN